MASQVISIILPVYNQADHVGLAVQDYIAALAQVPYSYELILVPNACNDNSQEVCEDLARAYANVRTIWLDQKGWGRAVRAGLREAKGDVFCYANLARTPAQVLVLALLYAVSHKDVVIKAARRTRDSIWRRLGSILYNLECRVLFDLAVWDINGTPKVFSRKHQRLLELSRDDDLLDLEFVVICGEEKYSILEVPTLLKQRFGGKSTTTYWSAAKLYVGALQLYYAKKKGRIGER